MTHFTFLRAEWPQIAGAASKAEALAMGDPRTACFYARRSLEMMVTWLYEHDGSLRRPYQDHLSALIYEPSFLALLESRLVAKAKLIKDLGNLAVHSTKPVRVEDSVAAVRDLFHLGYWQTRAALNGRRERGRFSIRFADRLRALARPSPWTTPAPERFKSRWRPRLLCGVTW